MRERMRCSGIVHDISPHHLSSRDDTCNNPQNGEFLHHQKKKA
jgi:hypothetical protein